MCASGLHHTQWQRGISALAGLGLEKPLVPLGMCVCVQGTSYPEVVKPMQLQASPADSLQYLLRSCPSIGQCHHRRTRVLLWSWQTHPRDEPLQLTGLEDTPPAQDPSSWLGPKCCHTATATPAMNGVSY